MVIQLPSKFTSSLEFLGIWETLNNPNFNRVEFDPLLADSGKNSFTRWINEFNAIGIKIKPTKNGGTFAHRDIALEFASWISEGGKIMDLIKIGKFIAEKRKSPTAIIRQKAFSFPVN